MKQIIAIACVDKNFGIGYKNKLLFNIPADMKFFKETTMNKVVVYGHNTLKTLPNGKPLKNRLNIVLTSSDEIKGCLCVHSLAQLLDTINTIDEDIYIIGGESLYAQMLPYCTKLLITKVDRATMADSFFPNLNNYKQFTLTNESSIMEFNKNKFQFLEYTRCK